MARKPSDAKFNGRMAPMPSEQELAIARNYEARAMPNAVPKRLASGRGGYAMTADDAIAAASLMDRNQFVSPVAGFPVAASVGEFRDTSEFFGRDNTGIDGPWDEFYNYEQSGYDYENYAGQEVRINGRPYIRPGIAVTAETQAAGLRDNPRGPAAISVVGTSSINPERPRTVAAGYDEDRKVLTVVFRDGTFYNYYTVEPQTWDRFKAEWSKGRFIASTLDSYPRGTARMANASLAAREGLYRVARTGQWMGGGLVENQIDRSRPAPRLNPTKSRPRKK